MRVEGVGSVVSASKPVEPILGLGAGTTAGKERLLPDKPHQSEINPVQLSHVEKNLLPLSEKAVLEAIEKANRSVAGASTRFEFSIHEKTKQIMVKVIDKESNELIREIPPEKILDIIAGIWDTVGLFVDQHH